MGKWEVRLGKGEGLRVGKRGYGRRVKCRKKRIGENG